MAYAHDLGTPSCSTSLHAHDLAMEDNTAIKAYTDCSAPGDAATSRAISHSTDTNSVAYNGNTTSYTFSNRRASADMAL
jgi:hypothetical protein